MRIHTTVMCVEHLLEGKMYSAKHKKTHKNGKQKESSDPPPPAKKQRIAEHYEYNICGASFDNVQELKDHFLTHKEENKEDEEESSDEDPLVEKALGNALRVNLICS